MLIDLVALDVLKNCFIFYLFWITGALYLLLDGVGRIIRVRMSVLTFSFLFLDFSASSFSFGNINEFFNGLASCLEFPSVILLVYPCSSVTKSVYTLDRESPSRFARLHTVCVFSHVAPHFCTLSTRLTWLTVYFTSLIFSPSHLFRMDL